MIGKISDCFKNISKFTLIVGYFITEVLCTTCYKNDNIGNVEGNVYYCNEESKPECCEENQEFTCCQTQSQKTMEEQLILWGSVAGVCVLIAIIFLCLFKDVKCCGSDTTIRQKCCRCCKKKEEEDQVETMNHYKSKYEPFPHKGRNSSIGDEDLKIRPDSSTSKINGGNWYQYY